MPAATTKAEIVTVTEKEWGKLTRLLDQITPEFGLQKFDDDTSIKDVIAHRAHWIDLFLGWYADGLAGKKVHFPAKGYKWNDLKAYNAVLRIEQAGLDWAGARGALEAAHGRLAMFYVTHGDVELYGGPMKGANNKWTAGRWSEAAGASHYRSAAKFVRKCIREAKG